MPSVLTTDYTAATLEKPSSLCVELPHEWNPLFKSAEYLNLLRMKYQAQLERYTLASNVQDRKVINQADIALMATLRTLIILVRVPEEAFDINNFFLLAHSPSMSGPDGIFILRSSSPNGLLHDLVLKADFPS